MPNIPSSEENFGSWNKTKILKGKNYKPQENKFKKYYRMEQRKLNKLIHSVQILKSNKELIWVQILKSVSQHIGTYLAQDIT